MHTDLNTYDDRRMLLAICEKNNISYFAFDSLRKKYDLSFSIFYSMWDAVL